MASAVPSLPKGVSLLLGKTRASVQTHHPEHTDHIYITSVTPHWLLPYDRPVKETNSLCFFSAVYLHRQAASILSFVKYFFPLESVRLYHWSIVSCSKLYLLLFELSSIPSPPRTRDGSVHFWECPRSIASLQHMCRMALRRVMTTQQVEILAIPTPLRDYLTYKVI